MIYDCFTFFNELDLLEIRLNILNEAVDKFVLVEATRTHRGNPKPLYFAENKQRFASFLDKMIHIVVDSYEPVEKYIASKDSDPMLHSWAYENFQRHSIIRGLDDLKDADTLIISDLDEIPTAKSVLTASASAKKGKSCLLETDHRSYYLNFRNFSMPNWGLGPMVLSGKTFRNPRTYQNAVRPLHVIGQLLSPPSPQLVRALKPDVTIRKSGWHFSFMGGIENIQYKLRQFSHSEYSSNDFADKHRIAKLLNVGADIFARNDRYYADPPEKCLPRYILDNLAKYRHLVYKTDAAYLKQTKWPKLRAKLFYHLRIITPSTVKQIIFRFFFASPKK